jgi:hypothetical protein
MINIKEGQFSKKLGKTRRKTTLNRGRRELSHHYSEKILKENQLLENPKCLRQGGKDQGRHLLNVGVMGEIICLNIVLTEVIK